MCRVLKAHLVEYDPVAPVTLDPLHGNEKAAEGTTAEPRQPAQVVEVAGQAQGQAQLEELLERARAITMEERRAAAAEGFAEGFRKGLAEGTREALDRLSDVLEQASSLLLETRRARENAVRDLEPEIISLACSIAERIIKKAVEMDPETVVRVARHVLESAELQAPLTLKVNPQDLEILRGRVEELKNLVGGQVELSTDECVSRGGCVVESQGGSIDGTLLTQLENIKKQLLEAIGSAKEGVNAAQ